MKLRYLFLLHLILLPSALQAAPIFNENDDLSYISEPDATYPPQGGFPIKINSNGGIKRSPIYQNTGSHTCTLHCTAYAKSFINGQPHIGSNQGRVDLELYEYINGTYVITGSKGFGFFQSAEQGYEWTFTSPQTNTWFVCVNGSIDGGGSSYYCHVFVVHDTSTGQNIASDADSIPTNFFAGQTYLGNGIYYLSSFQYYSYEVYPVIYKTNFGYVGHLGDDSGSGIYLDDFGSTAGTSLGSLYTSQTQYPNFYSYSLVSWIHYFENTYDPRVFYVYSTSTYIYK